jgi:hypothetical protein
MARNGGDRLLHRFIGEQNLAKTTDPGEEIATSANRGFLHERLATIRIRKQEIENASRNWNGSTTTGSTSRPPQARP